MAFLRCDFSSAALDMQTSMQVILPENIKIEDAPAVYLLHGLTDNCTAWSRYTSVERYARQKNAVVIMPEVQRSFYCNMRYGGRYFDYITRELPEICRKFFHITAERNKTFIMGLSMGGYGAVKAALTYPDKYAGCASFSGVMNFSEFIELKKDSGELSNDLGAILGAGKTPDKENNLSYLVSGASNVLLPKLFFTCGMQDELVQMNRQMKKLLEQMKIECHYEEWEGDHNWLFWDCSVKKAFDYFL